MNTERCEVRYSGRVQGVGFRYTVRQIAGGLEVTGFVRNRPDGSVQLVVEGTSQEIQRLLSNVQAELGGFVKAAQETHGRATGEFRDFRIRY